VGKLFADGESYCSPNGLRYEWEQRWGLVTVSVGNGLDSDWN